MSAGHVPGCPHPGHGTGHGPAGGATALASDFSCGRSQNRPRQLRGGAASASWHRRGAECRGMSPRRVPKNLSPPPAAPRRGRAPRDGWKSAGKTGIGGKKKAAGLHGNPARPRAAAPRWDGDSPQSSTPRAGGSEGTRPLARSGVAAALGRAVPVPGVPRDRGHPKKSTRGWQGGGPRWRWGPRLSLPCLSVPSCLGVPSSAGDAEASPGAPGLGRARGAGNRPEKQEMPELLMAGSAPQPREPPGNLC